MLEGGCHCGAVRFRVDASTDHQLLDCNCTICTKKGYLHLIVDERALECANVSALASYTFGTHVAKHLFCTVCGVSPFYRPRSHPDSWDVNARCLDGFDVAAWRVVPFDGQNWERSVEAIQGARRDVHVDLVTLIVADYDLAIRFFVDVLGFTLAEDSPSITTTGAPKRWVVVRPPSSLTGLLLARADSDEQRAAVGRQLAGRVGFFLRVSDFAAMHARLVAAGTEIVRPPRREPYGEVLVFRDIAGNLWDLLGPRSG